MITVAASTWDALHQDRVGVRTRVRWRLGSDLEAGLDLTALLRVTSITTIDRSLSPGVGGYQGTGFTITAADPDRLFDPDVPGSYLEAGEQACLMSAVAVQVEIERADGTFEPVDIATGYVSHVRWTDRHLELRAEGLLNILFGSTLAEDIALHHVDGGATKSLSDLIAEVLVGHSRFGAADVAVDGAVDDLVELCGWTLSGTFARGAPIGGVLNDLARSAFGTLVDLESGALGVVAEHLPRDAGYGGADVPFLFHEGRAGSFERFGSMATSASEITATYGQAGSMSFRDDTIEARRSGRIGRSTDLPCAPYAWQAAWVARILQRAYTFPRGLVFAAHPMAYVMQLNDRIAMRPHADGPIVRGRVVGKSWTAPASISIAAVNEGVFESEVFAFPTRAFGSGTWGSAALL